MVIGLRPAVGDAQPDEAQLGGPFGRIASDGFFVDGQIELVEPCAGEFGAKVDAGARGRILHACIREVLLDQSSSCVGVFGSVAKRPKGVTVFDTAGRKLFPVFIPVCPIQTALPPPA